MSTVIKLIELPEALRHLAPATCQTAYRIRLMEVNGRCSALKELLDFAKRDKQSFEKLAGTMHLQLASKAILKNKARVKEGKGAGKGVLEFKGGNSRLFGFVSPDKTLIICTNTYWKTGNQPKEQNEAFARAAKMMTMYMNEHEQRQAHKGKSATL